MLPPEKEYKKTQHPIPSKTSPKRGKRACLCADGSYSIKCCDGSLIAQGIGNITGIAYVTHKGEVVTYNGQKITHNG